MRTSSHAKHGLLYAIVCFTIFHTSPLADIKDRPVLFVEKETFNFGKVISGKDVTVRFDIQNRGNGKLVLYDVAPSCAICTDSLQWPAKLGAKEKGFIRARLLTGQLQGVVDRTLSVYSNNSGGFRKILHVTGHVWSPLELKPAFAYFPTLKSVDSKKEMRVSIRNKVEEEIFLSRSRCDSEKFLTTLITEEKGRKYTLIIATVPPLEFGHNSGTILIDTSYQELPSFQIKATAKVACPLEFSPTRILLNPGTLKRPVRKIVRLSINSREPVEILEYGLELEGPTVEIIERKPGKYLRFAIDFPKGYHVESQLDAALRVRTSHKQFSRLNLPIRAYANVSQRIQD